MNELDSVSGKLQLLALIGDPIAQVGAPLMTNAVLKEKQIPDTLMVPLHVHSGDLPNTIIGLRALQNFRGAIITMPHKQQILSLVDLASDVALAVGGCNVIRRNSDGTLSATMLDGEGFVASLLKRGIEIEAKRVYLAGAGGAASAIAYAIAAQRASELIIYNRTPEKSAELVRRLSILFPDTRIYTGSNIPQHVDIAINGTSVGMGGDMAIPFSLEKLDRATVICEIITFPEKMALLTEAEQQGFTLHYGRAMLAAQVDLMLAFMLS